MATRLGRMTNPASGLQVEVYSGFSWPAFLFGPFWYFAKGMAMMGILMLILSVMTVFIAWFVCGFTANKHYRDHLAGQGYRLEQ